VRYRRALMLMTMTLVVPARPSWRRQPAGRPVAIRIWLVLVAFAVLSIPTGLVWHEYVFWLASDTALLLLLRFALMALAVGWAALLVDAWRLGQPLSLSLNHRRAVVGFNGVLCFSVAGTLLFGAHIVGVQRDFILTMFAGDHVSDAHHGRYNVLLLGGDSGAGRWGCAPDSMTIASIDEETGRTVLIGLPRNMANFPFAKGSVMAEQFPKGFDCEGCYLNGVSTWAQDHTALFGKSKQPGVDATIMAIEGITGVRINYWAMVNLQGFRDLVDAVRRRHPQRPPADPGRWPGQRRDRLHPARHAQARRPRRAVVLPRPRGLRRLLADGPPEVRDGCDAPPDQPADRGQELRGDRHGVVRDDLHQHPAGRGRPLHLPGPSRPGARRSPPSPSCPPWSSPLTRTSRRSRRWWPPRSPAPRAGRRRSRPTPSPRRRWPHPPTRRRPSPRSDAG
jgi:hypothetical protein